MTKNNKNERKWKEINIFVSILYIVGFINERWTRDDESGVDLISQLSFKRRIKRNGLSFC